MLQSVRLPRTGNRITTFLSTNRGFFIAWSSHIAVTLWLLERYGQGHFLNAEAVYLVGLSAALLVGRFATPFFLIFAALIALEASYTVVIGEPVSVGSLGAILDTNPQEASSMLVVYIRYIPIAIFFFLISIGPWIAKPRSRELIKAVFATSLLVLIITLTRYAIKIANEKGAEYYFMTGSIGSVLHQKYPVLLGNAAYSALLWYENKYIYIKGPHTQPPIIKGWRQTSISDDIVVVVMGETSVPSRYSLYGYKNKTTPFLDSLPAQSDTSFCYLRHVHSAANLTRYSVPMTFSFDVPEDQSRAFTQKNVLELAGEAGFNTAWLSAQGDSHKIHYIASYADTFLVPRKLPPKSLNRDIKLLPFIRKALQSGSKRQLIVVHLNGSHLHYKDRYDAQDTAALPGADEYDRSIHHTDRVLHGIVDALKATKKKFSLFYTSDHGEIIGRGHGYVADGGKQLFVPLIYLSNHQDRCAALESYRNQEGWISSLNNRCMILSMLGYQFDQQAIQREISHDRIYRSNSKVAAFQDELSYRK